MNRNVFISHCVLDSDLAKSVSRTLKTLSLGQIRTWYSTSDNYEEGFAPGDVWFARICNEITQCKILVVLLTPNSIDKPWIYFESGIAKGSPDTRVMPLCIGINKDDIKPPLSHIQLYQLSDYDSAKSFVDVLFNTLGINFYEEISKLQIQNLVVETENRLVIKKGFRVNKEFEIETAIDNIKYHIDKRFVELYNIKHRDVENNLSYTINIENKYNDKNWNQFVEIKASDNVQDILDKIYFLMENAVGVYTYMQSWILQNKSTGMKMVMYEITELISAMSVFKPNTTWQIVKLEVPYTATKIS